MQRGEYESASDSGALLTDALGGEKKRKTQRELDVDTLNIAVRNVVSVCRIDAHRGTVTAPNFENSS